MQNTPDIHNTECNPTLKALYSGEGIARVLMNREIANSVSVSGVVLDIGGKGKPSYIPCIKGLASCQFIVLDVVPDKSIDIAGSVVHLPFASNSLDCVLCFNVLEHVFDYTSALSEIRRVLKPDGILYGRVPFLFGIHADPCDYWRYTKATLGTILSQAGFNDVAIKTHGGLFSALLNLLWPTLRIGIARIIGFAVAGTMDRLLTVVLGKASLQERYPLGYFLVARRFQPQNHHTGIE